MAFFRGARDQEVTFAPSCRGGVASWLGGAARVASKIQSGRYEQQLAYRFKKLVKKRPEVESFLEEAEATAPEADWWSGGKQPMVVAETWERSSSEELAEDESRGIDDEDDILQEEGEFSESRPTRIEDAASPRASARPLSQPPAPRTEESPSLAEPEPEKAGASEERDLPAEDLSLAVKKKAGKTGGSRDKAKEGGKTKDKAAGKAKDGAKSKVDKSGDTEDKARSVAKSKTEKTADPEGKSNKGKCEEEKEKVKKVKKERKEAKSPKVNGGHPKPQAAPKAKAKDPFADSDDDDRGHQAPSSSCNGHLKPQPLSASKAHDPFADSDSEGCNGQAQSNVHATTIGRRQLPGGLAGGSADALGRKPAPPKDPFADSDDDGAFQVPTQRSALARASGSVARGSLAKGAPMQIPRSLQQPVPPATYGQQQRPAAGDSDSDPGF